MPDYKQSTETGTKWRRAFHVDIVNPLDGDKRITSTQDAAREAAENAPPIEVPEP